MAATRPWKRQEGSSVRPQRERGPADTVVPTPALQNRESPCFHSSEFVVVCYNDPRVHPVSFPSIPSFLRPFPGVSPLFLHIMFTFVCWLVSAPLPTDAPSTAACVVPSSAPCPEWPWPCPRPCCSCAHGDPSQSGAHVPWTVSPSPVPRRLCSAKWMLWGVGRWRHGEGLG